MNNAMRGFITISIFGAGFGVGYVVAKKKLENKYNEIAQAEIDSVKKRFIYRRDEEKNWPQDPEEREEIKESWEETRHKKLEELHNTDKDYTDDPFDGMTEEEIEEARIHHKRVITDYTKCYTPSKPSLDDLAAKRLAKQMQAQDNEDEEQEISDGEALGRVDSYQPYIIEEEDYDDAWHEHYDKLDLFYYVKDDTLIDEDDVPVENDSDFGDAINLMQNQSTVYMRNEAIGVDYAIHRLDRSYGEDVLGISETPKEREYRHTARRKEIMDGE